MAIAQHRGIEEYVLSFRAKIVDTLVELGSYAEAMELARELGSRLDEAGDVLELLVVRAAQIAALTRRGQFNAALELSGWTVERARESQNPELLALSHGRAAALAAAVQDLDTRGLLEDMVQIERSLPDYSATLPDAVRTALAIGDPDLAKRLAAGLASTPLLREAALLTARALIAEHEDRHTEAENVFADAAQKWRRLEMPWERAQALLGQGRWLLALSRSAEAAGPLSARPRSLCVDGGDTCARRYRLAARARSRARVVSRTSQAEPDSRKTGASGSSRPTDSVLDDESTRDPIPSHEAPREQPGTAARFDRAALRSGCCLRREEGAPRVRERVVRSRM